jgi:hypothetical protein
VHGGDTRTQRRAQWVTEQAVCGRRWPHALGGVSANQSKRDGNRCPARGRPPPAAPSGGGGGSRLPLVREAVRLCAVLGGACGAGENARCTAAP